MDDMDTFSASDNTDDVISVDDSIAGGDYVSISDADDEVISSDNSLDDALQTDESTLLSYPGSVDVYNWTALSDEVSNDTGVDIVNIKANLTPGNQIIINRSVTIIGSADTYIGGSSSSDIVNYNDILFLTEKEGISVTLKNIKFQNCDENAIFNSDELLTDDNSIKHVYVSPNGYGNGSHESPSSFIDALNNLEDNTIIHMADGNYTTSSSAIELDNNNIIIMADNPSKVMLKSIMNDGGEDDFDIYGNNIIFKDITFQGGNKAYCAFYPDGAGEVFFENCTFINYNNYDVLIEDYSNELHFNYCNFINNSFNDNLIICGINVLIDNCIFKNNTIKNKAQNPAFLWIPEGNLIVNNCEFINNGGQSLFYAFSRNNVEIKLNISSCIFKGNKNNILVKLGTLIFENNTADYECAVELTGGCIISPTTLTVLNNTQVTVGSGENVDVAFVLTDDKGNNIKVPKITFNLDSQPCTVTYNSGAYHYSYIAPEVSKRTPIYIDTIECNYISNPIIKMQTEPIIVKPSLNMSADDISDSVYGDEITVKVNISNLQSGDLVYEFVNNNGFTKNVTDSFTNNVSTVSLNDLPAGDYTLTVKYVEDDDFAASSITKTFTINKANSTIENLIVDSVIPVGNNITVLAVVPSTYTGNVTYRLNKELTVDVGENAVFDALSSGNYTVYAVYNGDDNYNPSEEANFTFSVVKLDSVLEVTHSEPVVGEDVTITIIMNEDVNDYVTVIINDKPQSELLINGTATVTIPSVSASEVYSVIVDYDGSEKYLAKSNSTSFAIFKLDTDVELSLSDIAIGEDVVVKIKLAEDINDNVTVNVDGVGDSIKLTDGYVEYTISNVTAGGHTIIVNFNGNGKYNAAFNSTSFTVDKLNPAVVAVADPIYVGDDAVITITVDSKATGSVLVGNNYYAVINDGSAKVTIPNLANGTYTYSVVYSGDEKYNKSETSVSVVVNKKATVSKVNVDDIELGQVAEITVSGLPSDATGTISIEVTGVPAQTINVGQTCSIPDLTNGTYTVNIIYSGDDRYAGSTDSKVFTVKYVEPVNETSITNITDLNTDTKDISISLPSDASGTLSVTVDGNTTTVGVVNGTANVPVNLTAGKHDVKVSYSGDGKYAGFTKESSVDVAKAAPGVVPSVPASIVAGSSISLPINLPADATGVVLVDVAGQKYYGEVTKGVANVAIAGLTAGDKTLTYNYLGDAKYAPVNGSVILKVTNPAPTPKPKADVIKLTLKKVKVKKSAKKLVISATLKINGKAVKGKKITFKFNKKTFTAKTNKKGVAKITVKKAVLKNLKVGKKVTYTAKYSKNTVKKTVKVKK